MYEGLKMSLLQIKCNNIVIMLWHQALNLVTMIIILKYFSCWTDKESEGSAEWSDGLHQCRHHPGGARTRERPEVPQHHSRSGSRHCGRLSSFLRLALQKKSEISSLQLSQERHSGNYTHKVIKRTSRLILYFWDQIQ